MCRLGKAKVLSIFLCPALPIRPSQTVVVVKSGQDGLSQTLYLQKWPKSAFEIVVRVSSNEGASGKTAPKWSVPQASSVGRMVDREAKRAEGKGLGYDRWASMHNLKAWSKTFMYLQEHDLLSSDKLNAAVDASGAEAREARSRYDAAAAKVTDKKAMLEAMDNYRNTYPVIKEYHAIRKEKDKQKFYAAHEADFIINDAAKRQLDKLDAPKQLPKRKDVAAEIQSLVSQKNECYNDYREKRGRLHELMTMQRNYQMAMPQPKRGHSHEQEGYSLIRIDNELKLKHPHTHSWTYTASGATITAKCNAADCTLADASGGSVTITAPEADALTYDGSPKAAAVTTSGDWPGASADNIRITYKQGETTLPTAPTDAGIYTAGITVGEGGGAVTASVEYTIKKADLAAGDFTFTSPTDLTYNGSAKTATVTTAKTGVGTVTVTYFKGENQVAEPKEAGEYTVKLSVAASLNYNSSTDLTAENWKFTIAKAGSACTAPTPITALTYTGEAQPLINAGTTADGTMQYSTDAHITALPSPPARTPVRTPSGTRSRATATTATPRPPASA